MEVEGSRWQSPHLSRILCARSRLLTDSKRYETHARVHGERNCTVRAHLLVALVPYPAALELPVSECRHMHAKMILTSRCKHNLAPKSWVL